MRAEIPRNAARFIAPVLPRKRPEDMRRRFAESPFVVYATRVDATQAAIDLIEQLRSQHGPLMFHQSGGCCDGSSPMCFPLGDFMVGDSDVCLGEIGGAPFYMSASQFDYWQHTKLIIDVVPGRGGMFSLENGHGVRFLTRSRIFTGDEAERLTPTSPGSIPYAGVQ